MLITEILKNILIGLTGKSELSYEMLLAVCTCIFVTFKNLKSKGKKRNWNPSGLEKIRNISLHVVTVHPMEDHASKLEKPIRGGKYVDQTISKWKWRKLWKTKDAHK